MPLLDANALIALFADDQADEATTITDSAPTPHTCTAYGNAQIDTAIKKYGAGSIKLSDDTDYVKVNSSAATLDFGSGDFTVEGWIYPESLNDHDGILSNFDSGPSNGNLFVSNYQSGIRVWIKYADSTTDVYYTASTLATSTWTHFAFVRDGNDLSIYVGGVEKNHWTSSKALATPTNDLHVGQLYANMIGSFAFDGQVDEVVISNVARYPYGSGFTPAEYLQYRACASGDRGAHRNETVAARASADRGYHANETLSARASADRGYHTLLDAYAAADRGRHAVLAERASADRGRHAILGARAAADRGLHRSAETLDEYRIYRGVDGAVDFSTPWQTGSSPIVAALAAGHTYKFVARRVNQYGLESQNVNETEIEIAGDGSEVTPAPSVPEEITVDQAASGAARIRAKYRYQADGDTYQADQFVVYYTTDGSDPDPDLDTPEAVAMIKADGVAKLDWTTPTQSHGTTIKVIVMTRRNDGTDPSPDWRYSAETSIETITADATGPSKVEGTPFFGAVAAAFEE